MKKDTLPYRGKLLVWDKKLNKYVYSKKGKKNEESLDIIYEKYPRYRLLGWHERIEKGDEYFCNNRWFKTNVEGGYSSTNFQYRRRIKK